jgi:colanic acid/amylovoran biosynthesis glycosyltransferase
VLVCRHEGGAARLGCPVLSVPTDPKAPSTHRRIAEFLRDHGVIVMLAEYAASGARLARACRKANVRLFVHVHGFDASAYLQRPAWVHRYHKLFRHASIIAPSRFLAQKLAAIGCPPEKLYVSPIGVDPDLFKPGRGDPRRLLAVGRLAEKKAPHRTIEAFAGVLERFANARLDIIGDGPLMHTCSALIHERNLGGAVRLLGAQSVYEVASAMRSASIFVQHSVTGEDGNTEGLPVSVLEAMASGLPVVATNHSGIPEAVIDGENGCLVPEHDVAGMMQAIVNLLAEPNQARLMGSAGRRRVLEHFTQVQMRDRLRRIMGLSLAETTEAGA